MLDVLALGFFGGLIGEFVGLYDLRERAREEWPTYYKHVSFWALTLGMALIGGVLAAVYNDSKELSAIVAVNIGASAPIVVRQLRRTQPAISPGTVG